MSSLNHKFFREFSEQHQEKILDTPIRSIVIDAGRNTELRYEVFERLNRGSMQLNEQELRNCVYRGPFNDLSGELEQDSYWRKVKGGDAPERRYKEREMILRFFAFANRLANYTGSLKRFLNEYMAQYAPREPEDGAAKSAGDQERIVNQVGEEILGSLATVAEAAQQALSEARAGVSAGALASPSNMMVGIGKAERFIDAINEAARENLLRLMREPFVARVDVDSLAEQALQKVEGH